MNNGGTDAATISLNNTNASSDPVEHKESSSSADAGVPTDLGVTTVMAQVPDPLEKPSDDTGCASAASRFSYDDTATPEAPACTSAVEDAVQNRQVEDLSGEVEQAEAMDLTHLHLAKDAAGNRDDKIINMLLNRFGSRDVVLSCMGSLESYFSSELEPLHEHLVRTLGLSLSTASWEDLRELVIKETDQNLYYQNRFTLVAAIAAADEAACAQTKKRAKNKKAKLRE